MRRALGPGRLEKTRSGWTLHWTDEQGRRRRKVLARDRRTAEQIRADLIRKRDLALSGLGAEAGQELGLAEIAEPYLEDLRTRSTARHHRNVELKLERVLAELGPVAVGELRAANVIRIRGRLLAEGRAARTCNLYVDNLRSMLNWAVDCELVGRNPIARLKRLPENEATKRYRRRALSEDEIPRLLDAADLDDEDNDARAAVEGWQRVPQRPFFQTLIETGARYGELRQVRWGAIDFKRRVLTLRGETTKARRSRSIPISEGLVRRLGRLRALHADVLGRIPTESDLAFLSPEGQAWGWPTTNVRRIFDRVLDAAGIDRVNAAGEQVDLHALRHTAATRLARSGAPLSHAQRLLGHSTPALTAKVYQHLETEDLRSAVDGVPAIDEVPEKRAAGGDR